MIQFLGPTGGHLPQALGSARFCKIPGVIPSNLLSSNMLGPPIQQRQQQINGDGFRDKSETKQKQLKQKLKDETHRERKMRHRHFVDEFVFDDVSLRQTPFVQQLVHVCLQRTNMLTSALACSKKTNLGCHSKIRCTQKYQTTYRIVLFQFRVSFQFYNLVSCVALWFV